MSWTRLPVSGASFVADLWIAGSGAYYACGGARAASGGSASSDAGQAGGTPVADAGPAADAGDAGAPDPGNTLVGAVFRSADAGESWTRVATGALNFLAIAGTPDETEIAAVGPGYTYVSATPGTKGWDAFSGDPARASDSDGSFERVWVADRADVDQDVSSSGAYIALGGAGYVVRGAEGGPGFPVGVSLERLPTPTEGPQSGATAVAGTGPGDVWAVGSGVFHRTIP